MRRFRTAGRGRGVMAVAFATVIVSTAACSSPLGGSEDDQVDSGSFIGATVDAWPALAPVGEATSPIHPTVSVAVQPLVRTEDGLGTLIFEVRNQGNEDVEAGDIFTYQDRAGRFELYDQAGDVRYAPVAADDVNGGFDYCLCSSENVTIPAGEERELHATYEGIPEEMTSARVELRPFTPVPDVPVERAGEFETGAAQGGVVESEPELQVAIDRVTRHDDGTLVRGRFVNVSRSEPAELDEFPAPEEVAVVAEDADAVYVTRANDDRETAATDVSDSDRPLAQGDTFPFEFLTVGVPEDVDVVFAWASGMRRSFPVAIDGEESAEPETFTLPRNMVDPGPGTFGLASATERYRTPMVGTEPPELPDAELVGAELPEIDVTGTLSSEAQPDWQVGVRGVVRGPGEHYATLLMDISRGDTFRSWPDGVGVDGSRSDLGGVTVTDPGAGTSYSVFASGNTALSSTSTYNPGREHTLQAYALLPALEPGASSVEVDVPAFGTVEDVPVVDGPAAPADGAVPASMRVVDNRDLRMDVLSVGHLGDGNGTLVRARLVNEGDPDSVDTPFRGEGRDNLCDIRLNDPSSGDHYESLEPCRSTSWSTGLGRGDQLVYEVRFPELPADIDDVVVTTPGYFPSGPVPVVDDALPWYLPLPADAGNPSGERYTAVTATVDRGQTTTQQDDVVEVVLDANVFFEFDSDELTSEAEDRVRELAGEVDETARPGTVTITGHTDSHGEDDYNDELSEDRADAVREVLESATGRSDLTFEVSGRGSRDPLAPNEIDGNDNPDGRERNRRVEITYEAS